ncbi:hypothetical protein SynBIOSU31_02073 [Synechococcus sp. BIOS-U3-1]|uniref:hypothetical protein n=1 Tax=Synechococcus sp. BIOS-U3-1 TaxID=1400865 RepID=UPI001649373E|nr:hypothetical protein [Synechococcus sp. BIOS-U3-1]QNI58939.1 hypothetical protein SynBIOSU31_02073 [Synechococcus sp. BIOS-U3-1]
MEEMNRFKSLTTNQQIAVVLGVIATVMIAPISWESNAKNWCVDNKMRDYKKTTSLKKQERFHYAVQFCNGAS